MYFFIFSCNANNLYSPYESHKKACYRFHLHLDLSENHWIIKSIIWKKNKYMLIIIFVEPPLKKPTTNWSFMKSLPLQQRLLGSQSSAACESLWSLWSQCSVNFDQLRNNPSKLNTKHTTTKTSRNNIKILTL